jgi:DNA repair protein RadC
MSKYKRVRINHPSNLADLLIKYRNKRQEYFLMATLNGAHEIIKIHIISMGTVNRTIVHPRDCFYPAIKDNAVAIIFAHNHSSGSTEPSTEDDIITKRLKECADLLGFHLLDHVIIGDSYYSYRESGKIGGSMDGMGIAACYQE